MLITTLVVSYDYVGGIGDHIGKAGDHVGDIPQLGTAMCTRLVRTVSWRRTAPPSCTWTSPYTTSTSSSTGASSASSAGTGPGEPSTARICSNVQETLMKFTL